MAPSGAPFKKGPKQVYKVDSPFTATTWPQIAPKDQDIILDMLCNLLTPLGRHRETYIIPSKGKKRKRRHPSAEPAPGPPPQVPALSTHLTIGLNSTTRHLEFLAALSAPRSLQPDHDVPQPPQASASPPTGATDAKAANATAPAPSLPTHLSVLVLPHPSPPSSLPHAHFPLLTHLASLAHPALPTTRLLPLSPAAEARLASSLRLPRVGALGIMEGAPGADALVQYVREQVGEVDVPWVREGMLRESGGSGWLGTKILTEGGVDGKGGNAGSEEANGKRKKKG